MSKHTPGPWVSDDSYHSGSINRLEYPTRHIAMVSQFSKVAGDRLENEANARLITAAPDLLEALKPLLAHWDDLKPGESVNVDRARAAIAKATGERL